MSVFEQLAGIGLALMACIGICAALSWIWPPIELPEDDGIHGDTTGWKDDK